MTDMPTPRPIETAPMDETDILLFGRQHHRLRPPVVAGWYERHTDVPGWYTYDDPNSPIAMEPTHWLPLPDFSDGYP